MSRLGKLPIEIPENVEIKIDDGLISVKGQKGELKRNFDRQIIFKKEDNKIIVEPKSINKTTKSLWGTYRMVLYNMVKGVSEGYEKVLEYEGVGYKAEVKQDSSLPSGQMLELQMGYSHSVEIPAPEGISLKTERGVIRVSGIDKELVGQVAANIRKVRPPEPYKGKGIRYKDEVILRKAGKRAIGTGT